MRKYFLLALTATFLSTAFAQKKILVLQTDFGLKDGAVSAMKGVAATVSRDLQIYDLTHEIPPYNIWEAGYRLEQTAQYWPRGTVFVSVVDPGVGSERRSIVLKTASGHYFIGPDNGQFTLIAKSLGISKVYQIDEAINRRKNSEASYTFHGRDVYVYTAARLAAGIISETGIGKRLPDSIVTISYQQPVVNNGSIAGNIPVLDIQYGNVWTNISAKQLTEIKAVTGDSLEVTIYNDGKKVYEETIPYVNTFSSVPEGKPLAYLNSLLNLSFGLNMDNFAAKNAVASGPTWSVTIRKH